MNQALSSQTGLPDLSRLLDDNTEQASGLKVDFKRLLWGVWQQRLTIVTVSAITSLIAICIALTLMQPNWRGHTTLLKKEQQDEFRVGRYGIPFKAQEYAFKTLLDTLMLPGTLSSAMRKSGINMPTHELARLVDVKLGRDSKAFTISVLWSDPVVAAKLTNGLAEAFIERNRDLRRSEIEQSLVNYRQQLASAEKNTAAQADALRNFEASHDISDIDTQLMVLLEKRQELEVNLRALEGDLHAATEEDQRLAQHIINEPDMIVQTSYYVNPLQKNLSQMEWELTQARGRYTEDNPKVKDLVLRIEKIKAMIESGKDSMTPSETFAHNPVKQELSITRYEAKAEELRLRTRVDRLTVMLSELSERIGALTSQRKGHQALTSQRDAALDLQRDLRQRVDSLSVLLLGQVGDFELLERASTPLQPERTGRTLFVIGLSLLGVIVATLIAAAREFLNPRIRTLKDLAFVCDTDIMLEVAHTHEPLIRLDQPVSNNASQFRRFVNDLQNATAQRQIAFVGIEAEAGTSTAAVNSALAMFMKGDQVGLVDADLRHSNTPIKLDEPTIQRTAPLMTMLTSEAPVRMQPDIEGSPAMVFTQGRDDQQPLAQDVLLIGGRAMAETRRQIEARNDWTLYNLPPIGEQEAGFEALQHIGHAVLVVRSGQTSKRQLQLLLSRMERHDIQVDAAILCDLPAALVTGGQLLQPGDIVSDWRKLLSWIAPASARFA